MRGCRISFVESSKVGAEHLRIGYGLSLSVVRQRGLYISSPRGKTPIGIEEPRLFSELGVFLVKPDRTVYWLSVQSMPFARSNWPRCCRRWISSSKTTTRQELSIRLMSNSLWSRLSIERNSRRLPGFGRPSPLRNR